MDVKVERKQPNSKMCLVCGMKNDFGLKSYFYELENKELLAVFQGDDVHQSYPGRLHGGISAAMLDETIGRAILIDHDADIWGVTLEFSVKFKKPVPLNEELRIVARITEEKSRTFVGTGELLLPNGEVAVEGHGRYLKMPLSKIADFDFDTEEWLVIHDEKDPASFEL